MTETPDSTPDLADSAPSETAETVETADTVEAAAAPSAPAVEPAPAPSENVVRGLLLSLVTIPVGVIAWVLVWQLGFIAAIVSFGIVVLAAFLYRAGSGGRVGTAGLIAISAVTLVTLVISFFAGIAADMASALAYTMPGSLTDPQFWDDYAYNIFENPDMWSDYTMDIILSVVFAGLGVFGVMRQLAKEARAAA